MQSLKKLGILSLSICLYITTGYPANLETKVYPVVVLGGGIGALSSALYLGRAELTPLVIEGQNPGGLLTQSHSVQNWPGELEIEGMSLTEKMREQAIANGCQFIQEEVVAIDFSKRPFVITTQNFQKKKTTHKLLAQTCIIAMGTQPNYLNVPGEKGYWGRGVTNCAICDGNLYKDLTVAVVGGGDAAVLEALYLSNIAKQVYMFVRKDHLKASEEKRIATLLEKNNVTLVYNTKVIEMKGDGNKLTSITLKTEGKKPFDLQVEGLFLAIGSTPNSQIFQGQLEIDAQGYIVLKNQQRTSVEGVYAVGDIADPYFKQAISAAGDGAKAALQAQQYISDRFNGLAYNTSKKDSLKTQDPKDQVIEIYSLEQFEQLIETSETPVIVDFYASWCGPCKRISPILEEKALKMEGKVQFLKVNVDKLRKLSDIYGIRSMPTVLLLNASGDILDRKVGYGPICDLLDDLSQLDHRF